MNAKPIMPPTSFSDGRKHFRIQFMCDQKTKLVSVVQNNGNMNALMNGLVNALLESPDPGFLAAMAMVGRIKIQVKDIHEGLS